MEVKKIMTSKDIAEDKASNNGKSVKSDFSLRDCVHTIVGCDRPLFCAGQVDCFWRNFHSRVKNIDESKAATKET